MDNKTLTNDGREQILKCEDCGSQFKRTTEFMSYEISNPLFKWKRNKCDVCVNKRVNQAFKSMPEILSALNTSE